jgi:ATP-binding cassette subfamily C protein PrsD
MAVVIAHRPSALAAVDKVLVVNEGRVQAFGARDEILQRLSAPPPPASAAPSTGSAPKPASVPTPKVAASPRFAEQPKARPKPRAKRSPAYVQAAE